MTRIPLSDFLGGGAAVAPTPKRMKLEDFLAGGASAPPVDSSPTPLSVPFVNQPTPTDPLTQLLSGGTADPDWMVPRGPTGPGIDPYSQNPNDFMQSRYEPEQATPSGAIPEVEDFLGGYDRGDGPLDNGDLTFDGQQLTKSAITPDHVYQSASHERSRLQTNKEAPYPYTHDDWDKIGGAVANGQDAMPEYDGSIPMATLKKPAANDAIAGIRQLSGLEDGQVLEQLYRGSDDDLTYNGADAGFRQQLRALNNYRAVAENGNADAKKKYDELAAKLLPKARRVWGKALENQERYEHLKQAMREKIDEAQGLTSGLHNSAGERIAGQALMDTGAIVGSAYYTATGQEAKKDDLALAKLAYDEVINEYAAGSKVEAAARGVGSSLFQGLLFARAGGALGTAMGGGNKVRQVGATLGTMVGFGAGAHDQTKAQASMTPTTEREQRQVAGRQAVIEAGVMGGFALAAGAMGAQTLESILGGGQKIQNLKNTAKTILSEMTEESATTALQDWNQKTGGLTPDDAPLMPQMVDTWIQTALTLGLAEGSTRVVDFITKPTKEKAAALGIDKVYTDDQLADVASSVADAVYGPSEEGRELTDFDGQGTEDAEFEMQPGTPPTGQDQAGADFAKQAWEEIGADPAVAEVASQVADLAPEVAQNGEITQNQVAEQVASQLPPPEPAPKKSIGKRKAEVAVEVPVEPPAPKRRLGDKKTAPVEPTNSLGRTASWVIRNRETGEVISETFNPAVVEKLNKEKYEAVPILEHLQSLNAPTPPVAPPDAPPVAPSQAPADSGVGKETGYIKGDQVEYTGTITEDGMREFVWLEGAKKGETGVTWTEAEKQARVEQNQRDWQGQQDDFRKLREPVDVSKLQESSVQAQKQADGSFKLAYTGTRNEVFPGEKFSSAWEARNYFKAERQKQRDKASANQIVDANKMVPEVVAPTVVEAPKKLGQKRQLPPVLKAAAFKQKLTEAATSPEEGDALYSLVEARAEAAGESVDDYVGKRFADVTKTSRKHSAYLKQLESGQADPLGQKPPGKLPRAEVQFLKEDGRAIIRAFSEAQDQSSLIHELGHVFRRDLSDTQLADAESWAGVKGGKWTRASEEKFARGFERYMRDGKAPTPRLESVFSQFKTWLTSVYKAIKGSPLDVGMTPEIRAVMDSLFVKKTIGKKAEPAKVQEEALPDWGTEDDAAEAPKLDKAQKKELSRLNRRFKQKLDPETHAELLGMSEADQYVVAAEADRRADWANNGIQQLLDSFDGLQTHDMSKIATNIRNILRSGKKDTASIPGFDELLSDVRDNHPSLAAYAESVGNGSVESGLADILVGGRKGLEAKLVGPETEVFDVLEEYRERLERSPEEEGRGSLPEASGGGFEPQGRNQESGRRDAQEAEDFKLSGEGSKDTSPIVAPYRVPDEDRLPPKRKTQRQPQLAGLPEDLDESVLAGQQGLFEGDTLFQSNDKNPTSLKNAQVDKDRKALGLPPMMAPMRQGNQEAWDEAMGLINSDPTWLDSLVSELVDRPRAVNPVENSGLLHRRITLRLEHRKALDALDKANESGDKHKIAAASKAVNERLAILADFEQVTKNVGSADGRALQARKMFADDDYSLVKMELEARAKKGDDITPEERAEIKRLQGEIAKLQAQLIAKEEADAKKQLDLGIDALLGDLKKTEGSTGKGKKPIDSKPIVSAIKAKVKKGETQEITSLVQKLARYFWQKGVRGREDMTNSLHGVLEKIIPGWTLEQTRRAFNGYGDFTPVSMDEMTVGIADLKAQDREVMKAEAIIAGKPLEKTGLQRRDDSDEVRRLKKVTNELKRLHGVVVTDPETQLKSALGARKTYYRHRMADLKHEIDTRQLILKTKSPSPTDAELDSLVEEYNDLKRQHAEIFKKPELTDEQRLAIAIEAAKRNEQAWITKLENAKTGVFNLETGKKQPVTNAQLEAIKSRVEAIRAEVSLLKDLDSALQEQKKIKGLTAALANIEQTIKDGDVDLTQPTEGPDSKEVFELKEKLNAAREQLKELRELKGVYNARRLAAAKEAAQKAIDSLDARIKAGDIAVKKAAKSGPVDSELKYLRYQRDYLNKVMAEMRNAVKPKKSAEEIALAAIKSRMKTRMADLQQKMADGDFEKKPRKKVALDSEAAKTREELDKVVAEYQKMLAKFEWDQLSNLEKTVKTTIALAANAYDLGRVVRTTGEFSPVLRQGFWPAMAHPIRVGITAGKALYAAAPRYGIMPWWLKGGGDAYASAVEEEIFNHPKYDEMRAAGVHFTKEDTPLNQKEESLMSRWLGDRWNIKGVNVNPLRPFERFARVFLNKVRFDSYLYLERNITRTGTADAKEGKVLAAFTNQATGRGSLGKAGEQAGVLLARIFFSPRYIASRLQLLVGQSMWGGTNRTRRAIAMEYLRMARGFSMFTGMLVWGLSGSDDEDDKLNIELDWRSSDFGKIRIGDTRLDMLAGWAQIGTFVGRVWTGETKNQFGEVKSLRGEDLEFGEQDVKDAIFNFGRSKLHPTLGSALNIAIGTDYNGDPTSVSRELGLVFTPMTYPEVFEVIEAHSPEKSVPITTMAIFGLGVQNYSIPPERLHKYAAKQAAQAILSNGRPQQIKKKLGSKEEGETDEEYAKRLANWKSDREWSKKWLVENKETPLVQEFVAEMRKKIPAYPEFKPNKSGDLEGVDLTYDKRVSNWKDKYADSKDVLKSLK